MGRIRRIRASATRIFHPPEERVDRAVHHLVAKPEAGQDLPGARLERVPVELLEPGLHVTEALDDRVQLVHSVRVRHRELELRELRGDGGDLARAGDGLRDDRAARHLADVLAEVADGHPAVDHHVAAVRRLLSHDEPEHRRLAGAVWAHQPHPVARERAHRRVEEEDLATVLLADRVEANHGAEGGREAGPTHAERAAELVGSPKPRPSRWVR